MPKRHPFFLNIAPAAARDPRAPYAVLPLPYERTVSFGTGTARGPAAILRASREIEDFDEELRIPTALRVQTLPRPRWAGLSAVRALATIRRAAEPALRQGRFLLSLGGEHTITAPLVEAGRAVHGRLGVLQVDAHTDLRDAYRGTRLSHACVMRRVREMGVSTVHAGIRSCCREEYDLVRKRNIPVFWAADIARDNRNRWIRRAVDALPRKVYVTVDVDGLDPAVAPGTGTPEPGGLSWNQVTGLLREVFRRREVVAADIVEVAPIPGSYLTEFVAARLGARMLVYHRHRDRL